MDDTSADSFDHPISDLVGEFLNVAKALVAVTDPAHSDARPAELSYELDQVVSNYLDQHQLSPDHFDAIQQDVVNTIAQNFSQDSAEHGPGVSFDDQGNAGLHDVVALLDHHFASDTHFDHISQPVFIPDVIHQFDPG